MDFCYAILDDVSRSFSVVIGELPSPVKDVVWIFYLILRGLDTIEDDINYPNEKKIPLLRNFHTKLLIDNWSLSDVGEKTNDRILLNTFDKIVKIVKAFDVKYKSILYNITRKMGNGMSDFSDKNGSIDTLNSYNLYCHYVVGLVGRGLSDIFERSELEDNSINSHKHLSNSMGLFLQKTNIIRDYLEDLKAGRTWWPKQIWENYASHVSEFVNNPNEERSLQCLNDMVTGALGHLPHVIHYLCRVIHQKIFQFCAIPQVMPMETLVEFYNNPRVFTSIVKYAFGSIYLLEILNVKYKLAPIVRTNSLIK